MPGSLMYVPSRKACLELGVHPNTLWRWTDEGFAFAIQIPTGLITKGCCLYFLNATFNLGQK